MLFFIAYTSLLLTSCISLNPILEFGTVTRILLRRPCMFSHQSAPPHLPLPSSDKVVYSGWRKLNHLEF
ncbi:hypothetical protein PVAP13_6NG109609 [Panicum virgatum]|uniref:Uncharacterized protein n=1 Tax=Panicum virgatum TaxID=38727 RepID=A0A8T0QYY6_PANVG|nr:hypothetical protein PVAP13_6NG109609 [Panicum virgatum]